MKLKQETRVLKRKALSSIRRALMAFNSPDDDGRSTTVLLEVQHAFEMLLKAMLVHRHRSVFDPKLGRSIGFEECVRLASNDAKIKLTTSEAGTLRALDAMRDDEQHWFNIVDEQVLYLHARASVTLFDDLLHRIFGERLADHLPHRVLPLSTTAPEELQLLIDREYSQIKALLAPGRRQRHEARGRIRTLLAMEAHVEPDTRVSAKDVYRVEKGVRAGRDRSDVFPKLSMIGTEIGGSGLAVTVRFSKSDGLPVRYVKEDTPDAAAIREFDLQKRYPHSPTELARKLGLTPPRSRALRRHLGIDSDPTCRHVFDFGTQKHPRYSDNAFVKMRDAAATLDLDRVWAGHKSNKAEQSCPVPGCALPPTAKAKAS